MWTKKIFTIICIMVKIKTRIWLGLGCLMPLSTIFLYIVAVSFIWWRKPEYSDKTNDLPQVTDKLYRVTFLINNPYSGWNHIKKNKWIYMYYNFFLIFFQRIWGCTFNCYKRNICIERTRSSYCCFNATFNNISVIS
jgi:hypothetical protein